MINLKERIILSTKGKRMKIDNILKVTSRRELRDWLITNCETAKYCWITVSIQPEVNKLLYLDAVEEALCFRWIDGIKKKLDGQLVQRLSPRSTKSNWTELNKERVRRLEKQGLMTDFGAKVLPNMDPSFFIIDEQILQRLKEDLEVYKNFTTFPELYQRIRIDTIQSNKKETELFEKRLDKLIDHTKLNKLYGSWHDDGRLLDY